MASDAGRAESAVHSADKSSLVKNPDELDVERKDKYLKRMKAEDKAIRENFKKVEHYLVVEGNKVLRKLVNASGSEYSMFMFSIKRHEGAYKKLLKDGKLVVADRDGKSVEYPLKFVNGKPFKKA